MKKSKLKDLAILMGSGSTPSRTEPSYWDSNDIPWLKTDQLGEYKISNTHEYISQKAFDECSLKKYPAGSIAIAMYGEGKTRGSVSLLDSTMTTNQACFTFTVDDKKINNKYVYYYIKQQYDTLRKLSSGVRNNLNADTLKDFEINYPESRPHQDSIANLLSTIDDKIIINNATITELESLSKTLYDYYFLQFDFPDEKGRPYKSSGGKMEYNAELGREIPTGWKVGKLTNYVSVIDCLHSKKPDYQYEDEKCYLIQLENLIDSGLIDLSSKYYVTKSDYDKWTSKIEVTEGDILVTNAGRVGGVYRIPSNCKAGIGRNMTALHPTKLPATYIYYYLISKDADQQIRQNTDLGTFFKSLNVKGIKLLKIIKPDEHTLKAFVNRANLTRSRIEACHNENRHLTALRDFLLPLLMNGQVGFKK